MVNPARRELDTRRRSLQSRLTRQRAEYAALTMHPEADEKKVSQWEQRKANLVEAIEHLEHELSEVKRLQSETPRHLSWEALPEESKFEQLAPSRKRLLDTVKMIAYRAETAMVGIVRESLSRVDDARSLLQDLFRLEADLLPDADYYESMLDRYPRTTAPSRTVSIASVDDVTIIYTKVLGPRCVPYERQCQQLSQEESVLERFKDVGYAAS